MGLKEGRRVKKIEVPRDTPTEFELGDKTADIQRRREERETREKEEEAQKQREEKQREESMKGGELQTQQKRVQQKHMQGQTKVTQKWTQMVEERQVHLNHNPGKEGAHDKCPSDCLG